MKNFLLLLILFLAGVVIFATRGVKKNEINAPFTLEKENSTENITTKSEAPLTSIIAEGLDTPWAIAFLPDGAMLVTERPGRVRYIDKDGKLASEPVAVLSQVEEIGEGGLLGIALHYNFSANKYVYFYYTFSGKGQDTLNRVVRMKYQNNKLIGEEIIVDNIPGNFNHNGGRIKFGPDNNLYITTGDAQNPTQAQDTASLAGKILRVSDTGRAASGNRFNSAQDKLFSNLVYSYGHRNPQGITWDKEGRLWSTEHGRSGIQSGLDELNHIEEGLNYGWPVIQGDQKREGMVAPIANSGSTTWAPAGAAFVGGSLFFAGLRGEALYQTIITKGNVSIKEYFKGEFGRIREVIKGPDEMLYLSTSNKDGRGSPNERDDKIIRINPKKL